MLTVQDLSKLGRYLEGVVSINVNLLKRKGKEIKEVYLEYRDGRTFVADINDPEFKFREYNQLRSIERSVARGKYGNWAYKGNCGYRLFEKFVNYLKARVGNKILIADPMEGSGTTRQYCREKGIPYWGNDLINGFNYLKDEMPVRPNGIWWHPPYFVGKNRNGELARMPQYSGVQWGVAKHPDDGSHLHNWDEYIKWVNQLQYASIKNLPKGGYLGLLIGSSRIDGKLYDPYSSMDIYGELESVVVKEQFNCMSDSIKYASNNFIPIIHEWLLIIRRPDIMIIPVRVTKKAEVKVMEEQSITWKELVTSIIESFGGIATKAEILEVVRNHPKSQSNNHVEEKIRQVLNTFTSIFERVDNGVYGLRGFNEQVAVA